MALEWTMAISTSRSDTHASTPPLNRYPRPAAVRTRWLNLNGVWQCRFEGGSGSPGRWQDVLVPFSPETALSGVGRVLQPDELLTYRRSFNIPADWSGCRVLLNFEAVDYRCICRINGREAGTHVGGYLPFSFDITDHLADGENELLLEITDPTDTGSQSRGKQVLNPGGIWYTPTGGVWQTVWLEPVPPENRITSFRLTPDPREHRLFVRVETLRHAQVRIRLPDSASTDRNRPKTGENRPEMPGIGPGTGVIGPSGADLILPLPPETELWSPENPVLHDLLVEVLDAPAGESGPGNPNAGSRVIDSQRTYFALRLLEKVRGSDGRYRLALNGQPLFLNGPLDQGYWPESGMTPPSEEAILFDLEQTKALGFNMIRKHIKVESRRWYHHADRLGLIVIQDMVSGGGQQLSDSETIFAFRNRGSRRRDDTRRSYRRIRRSDPELRKEVETELTGMMDHLHNHPCVLVWVPFNEGWGQFDAARIAGEVKRKDPTRLVDHASGWLDRGGGDFQSRHTYFMPLRRPSGGDDRVFFYSEYGGYNLAVPGHMWDESRKFGYRFLKTKEKLEAAYAGLMRRQLIPLISHGLSAAVYTQLSDVEIETNGYFTYDRKILKMDAGLIRQINDEIDRAYAAEWEKHHG